MLDLQVVLFDLRRADAPGRDVSPDAWSAMQSTMNQLFGGAPGRKRVLAWLYGVASSSDCDANQRRAVRNWLDAQPTAEGLWVVSSTAWQSAPELLRMAGEAERQAQLDAGQMELL